MSQKGPDFFLNVLCLAVYDAEDESTARILNAVIDIFEEEENENSEFQDDLSRFYMNLVRDIVRESLDLSKKGDIAALVIKLKQHPLVKEDPSIIDDIKEIVNNKDDATKRRITNLQKSIRNWALLHKNNKTMRKMFAKKQKAATTTNGVAQELLLMEVLEHAKEIVSAHEDGAILADNVDFINMAKKDSVTKSMKSYKHKRVDKVWKSGLQGMNRLFNRGDNGGASPGEFIGYAALSHHYKSGMLMSWARWIATLNTPGAIGKEKAPAIVFFSLENEVFENQMEWFKSAYANAFGEVGDNLSDQEIIEYVTAEYAKNGFQLLVFRKMGDEFGYEEYVREIESLEKQGYIILGSIIDYATLMKLDKTIGNEAKQIQVLCNRIGNYANHKNMLTITGFQLDTPAQVLADSGTVNVVKKYGAAHLADCKGIMREMDVLFFMHLENNHQGIPFVTLKVAKLKYGKLPRNNYTAYQLHENLGLLDDINGENKEVKDIYAFGKNEEEIKDASNIIEEYAV